jgi:hypothetical protein
MMTTQRQIDASWTPQALAALERSCIRHGGWERWRRLWRVSLRVASLSGPLPALKGLHRSFPAPGRVEIFPHDQKTVFHDFPDGDHVGVFERGSVRLEGAADRRVRTESMRHRQVFRGARRLRRWTPLDAIYFFGYALWHYHSLPFALAPARLLEHRHTTLHQIGRCDVLKMELPADHPTHSRVQTFFFDESGLLVRHDYVAEIVGRWARGAHYWEDYQPVSGILIARRRRVIMRIGTATMPIPVLNSTLTDVEVDVD